MVSRVSAPTLGGGGFVPRRESGSRRLQRLARGLGTIGGLMERREAAAQRTARAEANAALHTSMFDMDRDEALAGIDPAEKEAYFDDMIEKSVGALAESDREGAANLRMQGTVWRESLLGDDRKEWQIRQEARALDARSQVLDQSREDLAKVAEGLFDTSDPAAPTRAAALSGTVKQRYEEAIADLPAHLQDAYRREFSHEASRLTVQAWLASAADPERAYGMLRSNKDEVVMPNGDTFNLSGPMNDADVEKAIANDLARRGDAYRLKNQARIASENEHQAFVKRGTNTVKAALYQNRISEAEVRELIADPSTDPEVAEKLDIFLDQRGGRMGRMANRDTAQLAAEDGYKRMMDAAATPAEVEQVRQQVLEDTTLDPSLVPGILTEGRQKEGELARAAASGTTEQTVAYSRDWDVWTTEAKERVQGVGGGITDRLGILATQPGRQATVDNEMARLKRFGEQVLINTQGAGQPLLEALMPDMMEQVYENALGSGAPRPTAERFRQFAHSVGTREGMKALGSMSDKAIMAMLEGAGVIGPVAKRYHVEWTDDGTLDLDATLVSWEAAQRAERRRPDPRAFNQMYRTLSRMGQVGSAASLAGSTRKYVDEVMEEASP